MHDFDAAREQLGLPRGAPILESIRARPHEAPHLLAQLDHWEAALAEEALVAEGAEDLLSCLAHNGAQVGILTRNTKQLALRTLEVVGLRGFFNSLNVLGRECATPKPSPDGIRQILDRWGAEAGGAVMVGDYLFDLQAGRAAGAMAVWVDVAGANCFATEADLVVRSLGELGAMTDL
ncbi:MAG: HAD family hydrolase [Proteobacteria bacterium]|nr:HAD family hydrolase [Pseudomonadota bacterium]